MGDLARHRAFADMIAETWPDRALRVADVAGGHGMLNAELYRRGYRNVVTFDKRKKRWTERSHYHYGLFSVDAPRGFDLVVGMHPDAGTDQAIAYAARRRVPFAVVPCCIYPSAFPYDGPRNYEAWCEHLRLTAKSLDMDVTEEWLSITGRNIVLVGSPF